MPYTDKTKPSPSWSEEQAYLWHERIGIIGDAVKNPHLMTHSECVVLWDEVDKGEKGNG